MNKTSNSEITNKSEDITPKQAYGLGVISGLLCEYPPSISDISRCLDAKRQTVRELLLILEAKGYITFKSKGTRLLIKLTRKPLPFATQKRAA